MSLGRRLLVLLGFAVMAAGVLLMVIEREELFLAVTVAGFIVILAAVPSLRRPDEETSADQRAPAATTEVADLAEGPARSNTVTVLPNEPKATPAPGAVAASDPVTSPDPLTAPDPVTAAEPAAHSDPGTGSEPSPAPEPVAASEPGAASEAASYPELAPIPGTAVLDEEDVAEAQGVATPAATPDPPPPAEDPGRTQHLHGALSPPPAPATAPLPASPEPAPRPAAPATLAERVRDVSPRKAAIGAAAAGAVAFAWRRVRR